jgi:hypothetical protein
MEATLGGCGRAQKRKGDAAMAAAEEQYELVNSKNPTLPLIKLPEEGTWVETWRKKWKRQPTNG